MVKVFLRVRGGLLGVSCQCLDVSYFLNHHVAMLICVLLLSDRLWRDVWQVICLQKHGGCAVSSHLAHQGASLRVKQDV